MAEIPVLKIGDCLLVSIQVDMHGRLAMQLQDELTNRIVADRARGVMIDISALEIESSPAGAPPSRWRVGSCRMTIINSVRDPSAVSEARRSVMGFARQSGLRQEVEARIALVATELDEADLEELVADRTRELAEVNQRLADEVSERRKAETALWHTQKFDLIGQLTGGIAHDFNNLLTVISGNLELIHQAFENHPDPLSSTSQPRLLKLLVAAEGAADHAAKITQQLLAFAEPTRVDHLLKASDGFLQRAAGEAVSVTFVSAPVLWQCRIDPVQLEAAILNLVVNARDAMPEGGTLWIEVANVSVDEASREAEGGLSLATMCGSSSRVLGTAWRRR